MIVFLSFSVVMRNVTSGKTIVQNTIPTEVATESDHRRQSVVDIAAGADTTMILPTTVATTIPDRAVTVAVGGGIKKGTDIGEVTDTDGVQHIPHLLVRWVLLYFLRL